MLFNISGVARLTRDPELKFLPSGSAIVKLGLAVSKKSKDKEEVCFIDATTFGKSAETINTYFKRGSQINISGELKFEQWTANDGSNRSKHTIYIEKFAFVDSKGVSENHTYNPQDQPSGYSDTPESNHNYQSPGTMNSKIPEIDISDEEIPF